MEVAAVSERDLSSICITASTISWKQSIIKIALVQLYFSFFFVIDTRHTYAPSKNQVTKITLTHVTHFWNPHGMYNGLQKSLKSRAGQISRKNIKIGSSRLGKHFECWADAPGQKEVTEKKIIKIGPFLAELWPKNR